MNITDEMVKAAGDVLISHVNAPEQAIYRAARLALTAALSDTGKVEGAELADRPRYEADGMHAAIQGEEYGDTFRYQNWNDKPHRVVYDAIDLLREAGGALSPAPVEPQKPVARSEWPHLIQMSRTLGIFASAIKSGEAWSEALQREYDLANQAGKDVWADLRHATPPAEAQREGDNPAPVTHLRGITDAERLEDLRLAAKAIRTYMPETLPADEDGKVHFARALAEAAADAIEAVLANTVKEA